MILNNKNKILLFSCLLTMAAQFSMSLYLPSFLNMKHELLISDSSLQKTLSYFVLGYASLMLLWGTFAEFIGRKNTLILTSLIFAASSYGIIVFKNIIIFDVLRIVQGAASGGLAVIARILVRDIFHKEELTKNMATLSVAYTLAFPASQFLGAILNAFHGGWHNNFIFLSALGLLIWTLTFILRLPSKSSSEVQKNFLHIIYDYKKIIFSIRFLSIAIIGSTGYIVYIIYQTISPIYLMEILKFSVKEYSLTSLLNTGAYLFGIFVLQRTITYIASRKIIYITMLLLTILGILSLLSNYLLSGTYFLSIMMLVTFITAWLYPLSLSTALEWFKQTGALATAAFGFMQQILAFIFSFLIAKQLHSITMLSFILIFLGLIGLFLMHLYVDKKQCLSISINKI